MEDNYSDLCLIGITISDFYKASEYKRINASDFYEIASEYRMNDLKKASEFYKLGFLFQTYTIILETSNNLAEYKRISKLFELKRLFKYFNLEFLFKLYNSFFKKNDIFFILLQLKDIVSKYKKELGNLAIKFTNSKNYCKSTYYATKSSKLGIVLGINLLGYLYWYGLHSDCNGVSDRKKALELFKKAANLDDIYAMKNLGSIYVYNYDDIGINIPKAIAYYNKAFELGCKESIILLGKLYNDYKDYKKESECYEKGTELDIIDAINKLAIMYKDGTHPDGVNYSKAVELLKKAEDLGCKMSPKYLGDMFQEGKHPDCNGVPDYNKAVELYIKSYKSGHQESMFVISKLYKESHYNNHEEYKELYKQISDKNISMKISAPMTKLNKLYGDVFNDDCVICAEKFLGATKSIFILTCGHLYHYECLKLHAQTNKTCPYCSAGFDI